MARMMSSCRKRLILPHSPGILALSTCSMEFQFCQSSLFFSISLGRLPNTGSAVSGLRALHCASLIQRLRSSVIGGALGFLMPLQRASYSASSISSALSCSWKVSRLAKISLSRSNKPRRVKSYTVYVQDSISEIMRFCSSSSVISGSSSSSSPSSSSTPAVKADGSGSGGAGAGAAAASPSSPSSASEAAFSSSSSPSPPSAAGGEGAAASSAGAGGASTAAATSATFLTTFFLGPPGATSMPRENTTTKALRENW
mmetsp:Transcript_31715/g.90098  ORF Transcript_31715/g.90098 Transcript_31715/m.90098 type:complete len:257 (+) Transcript_31715:2014-2784(+)